MLSNVTPQNTNPFRAAPNPDQDDDRSPAVDVSQAAMSRLRTPFSVEDDPTPPATDPTTR